MREPVYARINARFETPALITEDGRPLTEMSAIAAWLEARDTERQISFDSRSPQADRMHQLMGFLNTGFTGAFTPLWVAMEMEEPEPDYQTALRRLGHQSVIERHDKLEAMVGNGPYLVGEKPTLADALLADVARWLEYHQVADIAAGPSWRRSAPGSKVIRRCGSGSRSRTALPQKALVPSEARFLCRT